MLEANLTSINATETIYFLSKISFKQFCVIDMLLKVFLLFDRLVHEKRIKVDEKIYIEIFRRGISES